MLIEVTWHHSRDNKSWYRFESVRYLTDEEIAKTTANGQLPLPRFVDIHEVKSGS